MTTWNRFLLFSIFLLLPLLTQSRWTPSRQHRDASLGAAHVDGETSRLRQSLGAKEEAIFETFKHNLIRYHGVDPSFAEQFKINFRKAVELEMEELRKESLARREQEDEEPHPRQEEDEDDEDTTPTTTLGPSAISVVNGIYGILTGLGSLNPDRVLQSTANFFPPSQKQTADALIQSALGKNPGTWPTTTPTTTKLTTSTKDPDYDEDEDEDATTVKPVAAVAATAKPAAAVGVAATAASVATAVVATLAPVIAAPATG